jgi:hypothetical protein
MSATELEFSVTPISDDVTPPITDEPFDPQYPDSTPEAPYGFKPDGTPYKRHHGRGRQSTTGRMPASGKQAETAAALLARMNTLIGFALITAGMPESAEKLAENNEQFEEMARGALETDPALCRKILSAGATSGKAGLVMAYVVLGATTFPAMKSEYRANHPKELEEGETDHGAFSA